MNGDSIAADDVDDAERCATGGINRWRVGAANAHPMGEGVVPFCLESLSAQDHVDSGDETPWSGLRMSQIGEADYYNNVGMWIDGMEYAVPRPPKKPGGCLRIDGSFLWFFLWFFFRFLGVVTVLPQRCVSTQSLGLYPETWSLCVGGGDVVGF